MSKAGRCVEEGEADFETSEGFLSGWGRVGGVLEGIEAMASFNELIN